MILLSLIFNKHTMHRPLYLFLFLCICFFFVACSNRGPVKWIDFEKFKIETPPGVALIADNFYCDETEVSNISYREYLYWIEKIYGDTSIEYRNACPDTSVWTNEDSCLHFNVDYYLRHPRSRNYPVVGISQQQAEAFSNWRSDRVLELLLVRDGFMKWDGAQTKDNFFSREKYFRGEYQNIQPILDFYPNYRLPSLEERAIILKYNENLATAYFEKCKYKECRKCTSKELMIWTNKNPCQTNTNPTFIDSDSCINVKKSKLLHHLKGNVSEWTQEENIAVGGGWKDTRQRIMESDTFHVFAPNAWTGFRNVCEWKKWEE